MKLNITIPMVSAKETMSSGAFQQAASALNDAKNIVREEAQKRTSSEVKIIINKLQSNEKLSTDEIALIKAWIVGDASGYTKMENNFQDWVSEYERLQNTLANYEDKECSPDDLLKLHGVLEDAIRITYDIAHYLEKQDRVNKFELVIKNELDKDGRDILAKMLIGRLQSPKY